MHVFDSLHSNIWCNIRVPEGYFVTKYKILPGALSNVVALQKFAIYWKIGLKSVYFEAEIIVLLYKLEVWDSKFSSWRIVSFPANIYLINNRNTRKRCQDPKFKIKTSSKWASDWWQDCDFVTPFVLCTSLSAGGKETGPQFLEGDCWERGGDLFQGWLQFFYKK